MDDRLLTAHMMKTKSLVARKIIVKLVRRPNYTLLRCALQCRAFSLVPFLLERGADVTHVHHDGRTALHTICSSECSPQGEEAYDMCKLLMENGADRDVDRRDFMEMTPLLLAFRYRSLKVIRLLLDHGADISAISGNGKTALHYAVKNEDLDVAKFVMDRQFEVDCKDKKGNTALYTAAAHDKFEACELLLKCGATIKGINLQGCTPLRCWYSKYLVHRYVEPKTIELLLDYGADVGDESIFKDVLVTHDKWSVSKIYAIPEIKISLIRHMAKMEYANPRSVDVGALRAIELHKYYKTYYDGCLQEIQGMKEVQFYNNVTVFNVLMGSDKVISGFARNEELVEALEKSDYGDQYPKCFAWLKKRFYAQLPKHRLRANAAKILSDLLGFNDPLHLTNWTIVRYLSDGEIGILCSNCGSASI